MGFLFVYLQVCLFTKCVQCPKSPKEDVGCPLELELGLVVNYHVGAEI